MALPEPIEPEDLPPSKAPAEDRPDWLVGAEEGVEEELKRKSLTENAPAPAGIPVELRRPEALAPEPPASGGRVGLPLPRMARPDGGSLAEAEAAKAEAEAKPQKPVAWKGASGSVPKLKIVSVAGTPSPAPELSKRGAAEADEEFATAEDAVPDMPGGESDAAPSRPLGPGRPAPRAAVPSLDEPWWLVVGERIATDRKIHILIGAAVVLFAVILLWPKGGNSVAISAIRKHPERYEGQTVTVSGRVGEVYAVGQGHTFYLHQGRDTLVVYTRMRTPVSREKLQIVGSVTMGFLDGAPRVAVFETGS
jgi:hypothetical protein